MQEALQRQSTSVEEKNYFNELNFYMNHSCERLYLLEMCHLLLRISWPYFHDGEKSYEDVGTRVVSRLACITFTNSLIKNCIESENEKHDSLEEQHSHLSIFVDILTLIHSVFMYCFVFCS